MRNRLIERVVRGIKIEPVGMAMPGVMLPQRIRRMLSGIPTPKISRPRMACTAAVCAIAAAILAVGTLVHAQDSRPAFEVVSVKPSPPGLVRDNGGTGVEFVKGFRFTATNASLRDLVAAAYGLQVWQVSGGPAWTKPSGMTTEDRYMVDARAQGQVSRDQIRAMLQTLLADRFQLTTHRESKTQTVYDMVVTKNGPKLREVKVDNPADVFVTACCRGGLFVKQTTLPELAALLTNMVIKAPVRDKTSLKGVYGFELHWTPEAFRDPEKTDTAGNGEQPFDANGPSIFTAVQEQLGLKLEATKGPVENLVIDHVEKPSEN